MAAIYKVKKSGEVHIYRNRVPRKDGGEPVLGWTIVAALLFCVRCIPFLILLLMALLFDGGAAGVANLVRENLLAVFIDVWMLVWFGWYVVSRFQKIIFSPKTKEVYSGFLFFRRKIAKFSDLAAIELSEQEMLAKPRYSFVAPWKKDRVKAPLRLSPQVKTTRQLSRYYHAVVPHLNSILGIEPEEAVEEIGVEEVEVPVEEATRIMERSSTRTRRRKRPKGKSVFAHSKGVYLINHMWLMLLAVFGGGALFFGIGHLFATVYPDNPWWLSYGIEGACYLYYMRHMSYESVRVSFDTRNRMVECVTGFGLMKQAYSFDMVRRFTIKRKSGIGALCMVIEGQTVDPTIVNSLTNSTEKLRRALEEVCEIVDMDPEMMLAA